MDLLKHRCFVTTLVSLCVFLSVDCGDICYPRKEEHFS